MKLKTNIYSLYNNTIQALPVYSNKKRFSTF